MSPPPPPLTINDVLTDDELLAIYSRLPVGPAAAGEREAFGLVCRRWLRLQGWERRRLRARAGPAMLRRLAARYPAVHHLDLSQSPSRSFYPGVLDDDLVVIANGFGSLRCLALQNCKGITDVGIQKLGEGLPSLQSLDVSQCKKITDKGLQGIALGCPKLRQLNVTSCKSITDNLLCALAKSCPEVEKLGLAGCNNITDTGLSALADGCRHIKHLDISKCNKIGDLGICIVLEISSLSLVSIRLLDCYKVGDKSIFSLAESCHNLENLVIGGCRDVTDESIKSLALACCSSLRSLRMDWCLNITDSSLRCLLSNCRLLVALDIGCCDQVTDSAFQVLETNEFKSELKVLRASNCVRITALGVGTLLASCKALEYLDVRSCPQATRHSCGQAGLQFPENCKVNFDGGLSENDEMVDKFF